MEIYLTVKDKMPVMTPVLIASATLEPLKVSMFAEGGFTPLGRMPICVFVESENILLRKNIFSLQMN